MADARKSVNRSVSRALKVLQAINRSGSLSMMQIAKAVDLPYPTTCRLVNTLINEGVIEQEALRKQYRPTALAQSLSCGYQAHSRMATIARPHIQALTCESGWPVAITSRVGKYMVIQESTHALTTLTFSEYTPGYSMPILSSASGLAYMAYVEPVVRRDILDQTNFDEVDNHAASIIKERCEPYFEAIRNDGYAFYVRSPHTKDPGKTSSIAVPVFNSDEVAGAMTMSFFARVLSVEQAYETFGEAMRKAQAAISHDLEEMRLFNPDTLLEEPGTEGKVPVPNPA
jgi:IclR family mhp operon transcriptional activator